MFTESGKHEFFSRIPLIRNEKFYYNIKNAKDLFLQKKTKSAINQKPSRFLKPGRFALIIIQKNQFKSNAH